MTDEDELLPSQRMARPFWQEELNVLYVAMSNPLIEATRRWQVPDYHRDLL